MPMYTLDRSFDPSWTEHDFDQMMRRAISGLAWHPPVYWHRSFGIDKEGPVEGFCVYEADSLRAIQQQQRICWVPFTEAHEVQEACGAGEGLGRYDLAEGDFLFLVERVFAGRANLRRIAAANREAQRDGVIWVRTFWEPDRQLSRCVFAARNADAVSAALAGSGSASFTIVPVLEEHPSSWVEMYDQVGIQRRWEAAVRA